MKRKTLLAGIAIASLAVLNFTRSDAGVLSQSQASATSIVTEGEPVRLAWSYPIKCRKLGSKRNSYQICVENGPANSCDTKNATTCTCGKNCK